MVHRIFVEGFDVSVGYVPPSCSMLMGFAPRVVWGRKCLFLSLQG